MGVEVALLAASAGMQAISHIQAGRAEYQAQVFNAQQLQEQARIAKVEAQIEATRRARENDRIRRANIVQAAVNGIGTFSPSTRNLIKTDDAYAKEDIDIIRFGGKSRAGSYKSQADQAIKAGKSTLKSSLISAGASIASGGYDIYKLR